MTAATISTEQTAQATALPRKPRVLLLTHRLPYPPDRGDRIRSYNLVRFLSTHVELGVACTSDDPVWLQHHQLLMTMARRVAIQPISRRWGRLRSGAALLTGKAATPAFFYRQGLADSILQWHEEEPFDTVLTYCTGMIPYARLLTVGPGRRFNPDIRHVLDLVDVDSLKWRSYADATWSPKRLIYAAESRRLRAIESGRYDRFDAITVVSDNEADAYRRHVGEHRGLTVVRNGVDLDYFHPQEHAGDGKTLVFVGVLDYKPNVTGVAWFVRHVMTPLRQRVPGCRLLIVGRHPTPEVRELGRHEGVEVIGSVPDVRHYLAQAGAVIAPLRIARGLQNKVLEGMACRRVVVCSPGAAQGIDAQNGKHLLIADEPAQWVDQLERALTELAFRDRIAEAARRHVEANYSWGKSLEPMLALLGAKPPAA